MGHEIEVPEKADRSWMQEPGKKVIVRAGYLLQVAAFILLFIAFCSPNWIESWPRVYSGFKRIGLWQVCFAGFVMEWDETQKAYNGCWWILASEFKSIKLWLMPAWFIITQLLVTLVFIAELCNLLLMGLITFSSQGGPKISKKKNPLLLLQTGVAITIITAIVMSLSVVIFGMCFYTDRAWLPHPYLNYPSWSYGLAVLSAFLSIFAAIAQGSYVAIVRQEMREPPANVSMTGYVPANVTDTKV